MDDAMISSTHKLYFGDLVRLNLDWKYRLISDNFPDITLPIWVSLSTWIKKHHLLHLWEKSMTKSFKWRNLSTWKNTNHLWNGQFSVIISQWSDKCIIPIYETEKNNKFKWTENARKDPMISKWLINTQLVLGMVKAKDKLRLENHTSKAAAGAAPFKFKGQLVLIGYHSKKLSRAIQN